MEVREELLQLISRYVSGDKKEVIHSDSDLMEDLGFDSIQIMELFAEIEERFHIKFTDYVSLLDCLDSLSAFLDYVCELILSCQKKGGDLCE